MTVINHSILRLVVTYLLLFRMSVCICASVHMSEPASLIKCILGLVKALQRGTPEPARKASRQSDLCSCLHVCLSCLTYYLVMYAQLLALSTSSQVFFFFLILMCAVTEGHDESVSGVHPSQNFLSVIQPLSPFTTTNTCAVT